MKKQQTTINLVRSIMRLRGRNQVWNNKYEGGVRTVKCYRSRDVNEDMSLQSILHQTLNDLNIEHEIKFTSPGLGSFNSGTGGFIVRLPA